MTTPLTTSELRAAYNRVRAVRFFGWSFDRMLGAPLMRRQLEIMARIARKRREGPPQQELFT